MEWKTITESELKDLIDNNTIVSIGKMFGISDTAVKKKAKKFDIWKPRNKYNGHNDHLKGVSRYNNNKRGIVSKKCWWCGGERKRNAKKYCSHSCQIEYEYHIYINKWKLGLIDGSRCHGFKISDYVRTYLFKKYNNKCSKCGWSGVNPSSGNIPLEVDHIDGDYRNNKEENLTLLCPNCHSLTPTYRALNKSTNASKRRRDYFNRYG